MSMSSIDAEGRKTKLLNNNPDQDESLPIRKQRIAILTHCKLQEEASIMQKKSQHKNATACR